MVVTIYTDAAYSFDYCRAGFGYWITLPTSIINNSGSIDAPVGNPTVAEIKGIQAALLFVVNMPVKPKTVILYTDSRAAINILSNEVEYIKKFRLDRSVYKQAGREFKRIVGSQLQELDITISWRHVKAHENTDSNKQFINDWCDRSAKLELTKLIRTLKKQRA